MSRGRSACSFSTLRLNLVLTHGILPGFSGGAHSFISPSTIGSVSSLSGDVTAYRWRSLPRVRRYSVSSPQGSCSNGCWAKVGSRTLKFPSFCDCISVFGLLWPTKLYPWARKISRPVECFNDWGGRDTTIPSPGRSTIQSLPGI